MNSQRMRKWDSLQDYRRSHGGRALGAGLTSTANAVDDRRDRTTKSVVKLTADDTNNLPDHIVNGSFDYPSVPSWTDWQVEFEQNNKGKRFATINPGTGKYGSGCAMSTGRAIPNWNRSSFAWNSTQGDAHYPGMSCEAGNVELNYDSVHHNQVRRTDRRPAGHRDLPEM